MGVLWECCKCGYTNNYLEFCRQCDHVVCERMPGTDIPLLVIGCPRSATKYTAQLLQEAGAQVGHEWLFADGLVSCHLTVEHARWRVPGYDGRYFNLRHSLFRRILHQVREPLATIASLRHWVREPWAQLFLQVAEGVTTARIEQSPLELAMRIYVDWNYLAETVAERTYCVEKLVAGSATSEFLAEAAGVDLCLKHYAKVPTNVNRTEGGKKRLTWDELAECSRSLAARCQEMGRRYGYKSG